MKKKKKKQPPTPSTVSKDVVNVAVVPKIVDSISEERSQLYRDMVTGPAEVDMCACSGKLIPGHYV